MRYNTLCCSLFFLVASCVQSKSDKPFLKESKASYLSSRDNKFIAEVGKKLTDIPVEMKKNIQLLSLEKKVSNILSSKDHSKGKMIEVQGALGEIDLFAENVSDPESERKLKVLKEKVSSYLAGKVTDLSKEPWKTEDDEPFVNVYYLPGYRGPERTSVHLQNKLSMVSAVEAWAKNTTDSYQCSGILLTNPDPTGASLTASDYLTRRTSELTALANELDSVESIFKYVRDEVQPWPAFGATQSAHQIAQSKVGTFIDKATLLIGLLRAKGVPSQYILGDVLVDEDKLKGIWGVEGKYDLFWALSNALYDYWQKPGKGTIFYQNGKRTWLVPHAWVRAYIGGEWKVLDPSNISFEFGVQNPIFRRFNIDIDFEGYLVGQNQRGQYEKSGTLVDYVLETAGEQVRAEFGSGLSIKDLDLRKYGRSVTPEEEGVPFGTMAWDGGGCPFYQENLLPPSFVQKFSMKMKKGSSIVLDKTWDLPELFEKGLSTSHTAGLLGRVGDQPGYMKVYLGDNEVGSVSARTTDVIGLDYFLEYYPSAYAPLRKLGDTKYSITSAGDVYAFLAYSAPKTKENLEEEVKKLKEKVSTHAIESVTYTQFLKVANTLTVLQEYEQALVNGIINTTGGNLRGVFYTYGKGGIVKDREDRPYGAVPLGTGINWISGGDNYSRSGNFTNYTDYTNLTDLRLVNIIVGSQIEANIWEILYGVPGGSASKLYHLMAKDIFQGGQENILVTNQQLGVGRDAEIFAKFNDDMVNFVVPDATDQEQGYIKYKSILYAHKKAYTRPNGYVGRSMLILPTDPRAGTLALYGGLAPPEGGIGPKGGGTIAGAQNAIARPAAVDINDPDRPGSGSSCNPVSFSSGDMYHEFTDFVVRGRTGASSIRFERKYSTQPYKPLGDLGPGWTHNFQTRVLTDGFDELRPEIQGNIVWIKDGGNKVVFNRNADGTYTAPSGVREVLTEFSDRFEVKRKGGNFYAYSKNVAGVPAGRLLYFEEVHGERITANYNSSGQLESVEAPFAGEVTFQYNGQGLLTSVHRVRDNLAYTFAYNSSGYLESSVDFDSNTTRYSYVTDRPGTKAQNLLNKITDPLNQEIRFEYYDDGRVFQEIGKGEAKTTYFYSYFLADHLTRVRGENGATKLYKFDNEYRIIETEFQDGSRTKQFWDSDSNMVSSVDELGYKTEFVFDERGNRIGIKAPEYSDFIRTEYHPIFDKPTKVAPLVGAISRMTYDEETGDLLKTEQVDGAGSVFLRFTRDTFGNVLTTTNNETSYSDVRDSDGFLIQKFDLRNPMNQEYDQRGRVIRQAFSNGKTLQMEYDDHDRVTKIINNSGSDILNEYDVLGRLVTRTVTDGNSSKVTRFEFDSRNRQVAIVDPLGRRTEKKYDIPGLGCKYVIDQPIAIIDPSGRKTKFEFDSRNRLTRSVAPDGTVTRKEYNERGDLIAITDGVGNRSTFLYDGNGRIIRQERSSSKSSVNGEAEAAKTVSLFKYDQADRLIREEMLLPDTSNGTETAKLVTLYEYNDLGQMVKKTIQKEFMEQVQVLDSNTFAYKRLLDAPARVSANNDHVNLSFGFENRPPFAMTNYSVKSNGINELGIIEGDFSVENDPTGQIAVLREQGLTNPIFVNEFDSEGRLLKKTSRYNGHRLISTVGYDSFGRKSSISHDNGISGTVSYDDLDRITSIDYAGSELNFSEDISYELLTGNMTSITREFGQIDLGYDERDQLTSVNYVGSAIPAELLNRSTDYDRAGNRLNDTQSGVGRYIRNAIIEDDNYRYYTDPNGFGNIVQRTNKATKEQQVYDYWTDGKLRKFTKYEMVPNSQKTMEVDYFFDALGRRVAKKVRTGAGEFTQAYTYLGAEDKILLAKSGDAKVQLQVDGQGIDDHFAEIKRDGIKTMISDHLGTVTNSEVTDQYKTTGAFGEVLQTAPQMETTTNPVIYGFTGRQFDPETGLYYYRNRNYDSESGRFMTKDPKGIAGGDVNLYRYLKNYPTGLTDPFGLEPGDSFGTEEAAGYDALNYINAISVIESREYAGNIYQNRDGSYSYTAPRPGNQDTSNPGPFTSNTTAFYHTHGSEDPNYFNNEFSPADESLALRTGYNSYLGTPSEGFKVQSGSTGIQGTLNLKNSCGY